MEPLIRFRLDDGTPVSAGARRHSLSVAVGADRVYTFDRAGRLIGFFDRGVFYRRGLDGRLVRKERAVVGGEPLRAVTELSPGETRRALGAILEPLRAIAEAASGGRVEWETAFPPESGGSGYPPKAGEPPRPSPRHRGEGTSCPQGRDVMGGVERGGDVMGGGDSAAPERRGEAREILAAVTAMGPDLLEADAERFRAVYSPVAILPPDQYLALVLQVTEGCSYNLCRFCHFYRGRPFRVKTAAEFSEHVERVIDYFGRGLSIRRSVFLADANALVIGPRRLEPLLEIVRHRFFEEPAVEGFTPDGVFSFVDTFQTDFSDPRPWRRYRDLGLRRVYLGLESGSDELLAAMRKPATAAAAREAVATLKEAGLNVGAIVMTGLGGRPFAERHVRDTASLLAELPLGRGDLIYFSPFLEQGPPEEMAPFRPLLGASECEAQKRAIVASLPFEVGAEGVKTPTYDLREFIY